jgi:cyclic lactone autoinducer peptide
MKWMNSWLVKAASGAAALALMVAVGSVGATCIFTAYQPDVPEALR